VKQQIRYTDILVLRGEGTLPSIQNEKLLKHFSNTRVSTVFVTEDDLDDNAKVEEKVALFTSDYGMHVGTIKIIAMIAKNPTCKWGTGFPFKIRISVFPKEAYALLTSSKN